MIGTLRWLIITWMTLVRRRQSTASSKRCSTAVTAPCTFVCAQQEEVQQKATDLEKTVAELQKSLEEGRALMKEKDIKIEMQAKREKELIASVHR